MQKKRLFLEQKCDLTVFYIWEWEIYNKPKETRYKIMEKICEQQ